MNKPSWSNQDLAQYFEKVPVQVYKDFAIKGGIEEGPDIDIILPYLANTQTLLEIGACYGRILRHLLRKKYSGKIYAIERSQLFFNLLKKEYGKTVDLIHADISSCHFEPVMDAILWMWSDISGFPKDHQLPILKKLSRWLTPHGMLIIETLAHNQPSLNATNVDFNADEEGQSYVIESEYGTLHGYIPSESEVHRYGEKLGFRDIQHIHYFTSTGRERIIHIFKNRS